MQQSLFRSEYHMKNHNFVFVVFFISNWFWLDILWTGILYLMLIVEKLAWTCWLYAITCFLKDSFIVYSLWISRNLWINKQRRPRSYIYVIMSDYGVIITVFLFLQNVCKYLCSRLVIISSKVENLAISQLLSQQRHQGN